jgi:3-hydroxybutyrate dehydrogenase
MHTNGSVPSLGRAVGPSGTRRRLLYSRTWPTRPLAQARAAPSFRTGAAGGIGGAIAARSSGTAGGCTSRRRRRRPRDAGGNGAVVAAAQARFGRLDVAVAAAGFQHVAPVRTFPLDRWEALLAIHLTSPSLLARHAWDSCPGDGRFCDRVGALARASPFKAGHGAIGVLGSEDDRSRAPRGDQRQRDCPGYAHAVEAQVADQAAAHDLPEERVEEDPRVARGEGCSSRTRSRTSPPSCWPVRARLHRLTGRDRPRLTAA